MGKVGERCGKIWKRERGRDKEPRRVAEREQDRGAVKRRREKEAKPSEKQG